MIDSKDVSIIVQGAISNTKAKNHPNLTITQSVLNSCRFYFPNAQLILSTWKGSNIDNLDADDIILSDDPGDPSIGIATSLPTNINRQIVNSREGLVKANRTYSIKTRTDVVFTSGRCFDRFYDFPLRNPEYCFFDRRIIAVNFTSRNPRKNPKKGLFHVCDFFYAGKTEDLRNLFSIPLFKPDWMHYKPLVDIQGVLNPKKKSMRYVRYYPETYITLAALRRKYKIGYDHRLDITNQYLEESERYTVNNFIILDRRKIGIDSLKYSLPFNTIGQMYSFYSWVGLYNDLCGGGIKRLRFEYLDFDILVAKVRRVRKRAKKIKSKIGAFFN